MSTGIVTRRKSAMHIDNSYGIDVVAANTNLVSKRVLKGEPFSTQIVCDEGYSIYEITIKMGGVDITSTAYDPTYNMISIASVTGDVDIECYAMHTIPSDYVRVDGIKNPSNAYLNTGYSVNNNNKVSIKFHSSLQSGISYPASSKDTGMSTTNGAGWWGNTSNGNFYAFYAKTSAYIGTFYDASTYECIADYYKGTHLRILNGNSRTDNMTKSTWSSGYNFCLFSRNQGYNSDKTAGQIIYYFHIYDYSTTSYVRYYIPCLNDQGVAGFWDAARGVFQGSSNSTAFEATIEGAVVNPTLPTGYTLLKGCKNAGYAYFDTGYKCNKNTVVSVDVTPQNTPYIVASKAVGNSATIGTGFFYDANGLRVLYNANAQILGYTTKGKRIRLKEDNANGKVYLDGKQVYSFTRITTADAKNLYAYVYPVGGAPEGRDTIIYWIIIKEGDEFKRVYVAAKNSSNQVGFYDTVNDTFTVSAAGTATNAPFVAVEYGT